MYGVLCLILYQNVVLFIKKRKKKKPQTHQLPRGHTGDDQPENQSYFKQQGKNDGAEAPSHTSPFPPLWQHGPKKMSPRNWQMSAAETVPTEGGFSLGLILLIATASLNKLLIGWCAHFRGRGKGEPAGSSPIGEEEGINKETLQFNCCLLLSHVHRWNTLKSCLPRAKQSNILKLFRERAAESVAESENPIGLKLYKRGTFTGNQGRGILNVKPDTLLSIQCSQEAEECKSATNTSTHVATGCWVALIIRAFPFTGSELCAGETKSGLPCKSEN